MSAPDASPALLRSLRLAAAGTKLHPNAASPLLERGLIRRGEHRDWLTLAGRAALRAADDELRDPDECRSCDGYGHIREDGTATIDRRERRCGDCGGTGRR